MSSLSRKWIKWIAVLLGVAGMLTPALLELGWIPENQASKAIIFLLGFIVLEGATSEASDSSVIRELLTDTDDVYDANIGFMTEMKHEYLSIVHGHDVLQDLATTYVRKMLATVKSEKQLHAYVIVAAPIGQLSEESFRRRLELERDVSLQGRFH
jgi:hypothetical protein